MKYTILKVVMIRVKIDDFRSLESCAILPSKMVKGMGPSVTSFGCHLFVYASKFCCTQEF